MSTTPTRPRRRRVRALPAGLAAVATVLATVLASGSVPSAASPTAGADPGDPAAKAPTRVDVERVHQAPRGPKPRVAIVDGRDGVIRSGSRVARFVDRRYGPDSVRAAGKGRYVVQDGGRLDLARVGEPVKRLADHATLGYQVNGPRHNRLVYLESRGGKQRLTVLRLPSGRVVDRLAVGRLGTPLAYRHGLVWFNREGRLLTWRPGTDRVRPTGTRAASKVDVRAGAVERFVRDDFFVAPLRPDAGWEAWRSPNAGLVLAWSPDARLVALGQTGNEDTYVRRIEIRDARTGALVRMFRTGKAFQFTLPGVRWETDEAFLAPVQTRPNGRTVLLRLDVDGSFERVSDTGPSWFARWWPVWEPTGPTSDPFG